MTGNGHIAITPASMATLAGAVATFATLIGGGTATLLFLAGIQADNRVISAQLATQTAQIARIEAKLDRQPVKASRF